MFASFQARKQEAEGRLKALAEELAPQRHLNKARRVGRVPSIVVATHALYAYEPAAGLRMEAGVLATQDIDLFYNAQRHHPLTFVCIKRALSTSTTRDRLKARKDGTSG